ERRAVECVVAKLAKDEVASRRRELVDYLPAPRALTGVLGPDSPLGIAVAMCVLAVDDVDPVRSGELEQPVDRWDRRLGIWHEQTAALADEVVLHVDDDERGAGGVDPNLHVDLVLGDFDHAVPAASALDGSPSPATRSRTRQIGPPVPIRPASTRSRVARMAARAAHETRFAFASGTV